MKNNFARTALALLALSTLNSQPSTAFAQGTAFTYQGRLSESGAPASGSYDFRFRLASDPLGSNYVGSVYLTNAVGVGNGLFSVTLDFGAGIFSGSNYWLEVDVRTNNGGSYTRLTPLQELTPSPYAIMANSASNLLGTLPAGQLSGTILNAALPGNPNFSGTVTANSLTGNGANVTNVNAQTLNGLGYAAFWQIGGNNAAGGQFLGTTNDQSLELRVAGERVMLFTPNPLPADAPNVIVGAAVNFVPDGVVGATIGGGGAVNYFGTVPSNTVVGPFGTVGGGQANTAGSQATVGGGDGNLASGGFAAVSGGSFNSAGGEYGAIGGGVINNASGEAATVAGGSGNVAGDYTATVGGGNNNAASANAATIAGGRYNSASSNFATVGGGSGNVALGPGAFVGGGGYDVSHFAGNLASGAGAVIGGGVANTASGINSVVVGGFANLATNDYAAISGGYSNVVSGPYAFVGGGAFNAASGTGSFVGGGGYGTSSSAGNVASGVAAMIGGGVANTASGTNSAVGGGLYNNASGTCAFVGGGSTNTAGPGFRATVVGGELNTASGPGSFVGGGGHDGIARGGNLASGGGAVVGGGVANRSAGFDSVVGGGLGNYADFDFSFIGGGQINSAEGYEAVVAGGYANHATNDYATVPGGWFNTAGGRYSLAAGQKAKALHQGAFVWADSQNSAFASTGNDQFLIRAQGGVGINTSNPGGASLYVSGYRVGDFTTPTAWFENTSPANASPALRVIGLQSPDGVLSVSANVPINTANSPIAMFGNSGSFVATIDNDGTIYCKATVTSSDRNAKENFTALDSKTVLSKVVAMPVTEWNYKEDGASKRHIGPVAQDFHAAFGLNGGDDTHIATVDEAGVALAAIQGLNRKLEQTEAENAELKHRLEQLEQIVREETERPHYEK